MADVADLSPFDRAWLASLERPKRVAVWGPHLVCVPHVRNALGDRTAKAIETAPCALCMAAADVFRAGRDLPPSGAPALVTA